MSTQAQPSAPVQISPVDARSRIAEGALLVDVRERYEIEQIAFDVPGTLVMPMSEIEQRWRELPNDRDIVIACQSGGRSMQVVWWLANQGYSRVSNLQGGIMGWLREGFPIRR